MSVIGFDLDGVLAGLDASALDLLRTITDIERRRKAEIVYYASRRPLLDARMFLHALDIPLVVTARPAYLRDVTERWLRRHFDGWPVHFTEDYCGVPEAEMWDAGVPADKIALAVAEAKAAVLKRLEIGCYVEDQPDVVAELRRLLPGTAILQFGGRV